MYNSEAPETEAMEALKKNGSFEKYRQIGRENTKI
jgi:hypothetical protein